MVTGVATVVAVVVVDTFDGLCDGDSDGDGNAYSDGDGDVA